MYLFGVLYLIIGFLISMAFIAISRYDAKLKVESTKRIIYAELMLLTWPIAVYFLAFYVIKRFFSEK